MKNRFIKTGAAFLAAVLLTGGAAMAEERRLGDYIYVPAMSVSGDVGTISLRVQGDALDAKSGQTQQVDSLSGAQFGVYVFSGDGELTPWANPLYPSEQMRIRTGEGETSFTLPRGVEFYLRQESAPQGYLFDETALYRVEGDEIVVTNRMPGELAIETMDTLGRPVAGVSLRVSGEDGEAFELMTDENGQAVLRCEAPGMYTVEQTALPQDAFAALRVLVDGETAQNAQAQVELARRSTLTFEHPASGSVELRMTLEGVDSFGEKTSSPLAGVRLDILSENAVSVVTDEEGFAQASLLEGLYDVRLSYEGGEELILPLSEGQTLVKSGAATKIDLAAAETTGRIVVAGMSEKPVSGGSISFERMETGEVFGPYAFDEAGAAVSGALAAGEYAIAGITPPADTIIGGVIVGDVQMHAQDAVMSVAPGAASALSVQLLTMEKQTYGLYAQQLGDHGEIGEMPLSGEIEVTLVDASGEEAGVFSAKDGFAQFEALNGEYTLRISERLALDYGVSAASEPFSLPSQEEKIVFAASGARLILTSVDENGEPVYGAAYSVTDSTGAEAVVTSDADARAVTPLLAPGEVRIETVTAPADHDEAQVMTADALSGEAAQVQMVHPSYGTAVISARVERLDEYGQRQLGALADTGIRLYSIAGAQQTPVEMGLDLLTGADGAVQLRLEPGMYAAMIESDDLPDGFANGGMISFAIENTKQTDVQLLCMDALGGVYLLLTGELTTEEMAQVRLELTDADGKTTGMTVLGDGYFAGGLPAGEYTLRQTQTPKGYAPIKERTVAVHGGALTSLKAAIEEYAVVSVDKTGITFNDRMQTYIVPLSGCYGVYTKENGEMTPYPSDEEQLTLWSNVTPEQVSMGYAHELRLPAGVEGTTYFLREIGGADGFAADETYHEITVRAGERAQVACTVSSDRGFFAFSAVDAATLEHVPGGEYELIDSVSGEAVHRFTLGEESYRNAMAMPVGEYILRQISAGEGYAMSEQLMPVSIKPYLTEGGTVTNVEMPCVKIPGEAGLQMIADMYAAQQEGLTLLMIEGSALASGETLRVPQMTVRVSSENGERTDIGNVVLSGVGDEEGGRYIARVEYCLEGGGWQPSDARMTGEITAPVAVSLMDVEDDIAAVRVTYINAQTGEEMAAGGFTPGQISVHVELGADAQAAMVAEAAFCGEYAYRMQRGGAQLVLARSGRREIGFTAQGAGAFETVSAGRDGRITGVVFFDNDADGVMEAGETGRYAGMTVTLMTPSLEVVSTARTDGNGGYAFTGISGGEYVLSFDAGEKLVFSSADGYSAHVVSGVEDTQYGVSSVLRFDGDHTDYVVNAGCIYASRVVGTIMEKTDEGKLRGYDGLNVDVMRVDAGDEEPSVVVTDDTGAFVVSALLPGEYEVTIELPADYLCQGAQEGRIVQRVTLSQGDEFTMGSITMAKEASITGGVFVDDDADGVFAPDAQAIEGVGVALLRHQDGQSEEIARTTTDAQGNYAFDALADGEYSVLFELSGDWTFTRFGADSMVYGAASSSGSTQSFTLLPGAQMEAVSAGATMPAAVEVFVFADEHADGQKGVYDVGLEGVSVTLIRQEDGQDAQEIEKTTGRDGVLRFEGVAPGEYVLAYRMPGIYRATKQVESSNYPTSCVPQTTLSTGRSDPFTLKMGETDVRKYIGAMLSGVISGTVYYDNNADARLDEDEPGCAGVRAELLNAAGEVLDERISLEDGSYAFEGLAPGRYSVRFSAQEGCGFSGSERSMTRGSVQKSDESVSATRLITVTAGSKLTTAHAGIVRMGSVEGVIFVDRDADRVFGEGESGFGGVSVHLMNGAARSILMSATTDENGRFSFDRVTPGMYLIRVDAPQGYVFSGEMQGSPLALNETRDGRGYSEAFELLGGAHAQGIGYGLLTQGVISGRVWIDEDYDGYASEKEDGLRGAQVALTGLDGAVIESKTTIRSGEFTFDGLMPGTYALSVSLGEGYVFTTAGGESLADRSNESSASLYLGQLEMGGAMDQVMIGAIRPASVGGVVWLDENNDGRRADSEMGTGGVLVTLTMTGGADSGLTMTAMSDENGVYAFENVMPGEAQLRFDIPQGHAFAKQVKGSRGVSCVPMSDALSAQSERFTIASGDAHTDMDAGVLPVGTITGIVWEDAAYNGRKDADESGVPGAVIRLMNAASGEAVAQAQSDENGAYAIGFVRPGEYALSFELPEGMIFTREDGESVAFADAAQAETARFDVAMGESLSGMNAGAIRPGAVSGRVAIDWNENGLIDADEPGLGGAVITAMQGGTIITSTKTAEDGTFDISTLRPGDYRVRIALPQDTLFGREVSLALAHEDAQEGETAQFSLGMGERLAMADVAAVRTASVSGRAWLDADTDGVMDDQENAMTGVTAQLLDESGRVMEETKVDGDGRYAFHLLRSGSYALRFTLRSGTLFADQNGKAGGSCAPVAEGSTSQTAHFALEQEEVLTDMNVGGILPGEIGDTVFLDANGNGMMDYREEQLAGVALALLRVLDDGTTVQTAQTVSDEYGYYRFSDLRPGSYIVRVLREDGDQLTVHLGAPFGEIDSDADPETGDTGVIHLVSGKTLRNVDIGFVKRAQ